MSACLALRVLLCASALQATCTRKGNRTLSDWSPGSLYGPLGTSAPRCQHCKGNLVKPVPDTNQGILQTATVIACMGAMTAIMLQKTIVCKQLKYMSAASF